MYTIKNKNLFICIRCDLVKIKVRDISHGSQIEERAMVMQQKTTRSVRFEITEKTRKALFAWIEYARLTSDDFLFKSRVNSSNHISSRQYA